MDCNDQMKVAQDAVETMTYGDNSVKKYLAEGFMKIVSEHPNETGLAICLSAAAVSVPGVIYFWPRVFGK